MGISSVDIPLKRSGGLGGIIGKIGGGIIGAVGGAFAGGPAGAVAGAGAGASLGGTVGGLADPVKVEERQGPTAIESAAGRRPEIDIANIEEAKRKVAITPQISTTEAETLVADMNAAQERLRQRLQNSGVA